jgi:hypothetical protein
MVPKPLQFRIITWGSESFKLFQWSKWEMGFGIGVGRSFNNTPPKIPCFYRPTPFIFQPTSPHQSPH